MKAGYFFLHTSPVSRSSGASAVAAAAYNANQDLLHKGQRCSELPIEYRKDLNSGIVTEALRRALDERQVTAVTEDEIEALKEGEIAPGLVLRCEAEEVELSPRCHVAQQQEGYTLWDADQKLRYVVRQSDDGWVLYQQHGIALSGHATVEKKDRREWVIQDGENHYRIKEFNVRETDPETGKRKVVRQGLDVYADRMHRYGRKGDVQETWIQTPDHAPDWMRDMAAKPNPEPELRSALWNAAEAVAVARDERPARRVEIALLRDLTYEQNKACVRAFVEEQFTSKGLVADVAIHLKKEASDGRENLHAHILLSARTITSQGNFSNRKHAYWDSRERVKEMRQAWADILNRFCDQYGVEVRTDHRSYTERGIDREPGRHLGPEQWHMEERGVETTIGEANREIRQNNQVRNSVRNYGLDEAQPALAGDLDAGLVSSSRREQDHQPGDGQREVKRSAEAKAESKPSGEWFAAVAPEAFSESKLDALHRDRLSLSMAGRVQRSVRSMAENLNRLREYGRTMLAKTRGLTGSVFDRYATTVMRRIPQGRQRERETPER
jgi:hypothetical protein